jgi:2-polyprenyl-3-methyl-5-hydroxy-6-metoxy-1,4-benzoquinol methylase
MQVLEAPKKKRRAPKKSKDPFHPPLFEARPGHVRLVPCNACGGMSFKTLFEKESSLKEVFQVVRCKCGLVQVNPQPDLQAVLPYYADSYFKKRTDRGYDNYFSDEIKAEIRRVFTMNLEDIGFFAYEKKVFEKQRPGRALDAGCAAGYFVEYVAERGWNAEGIELSAVAAKPGKARGLRITVGDFLTHSDLIPQSYDFISFWASIEHMHEPARVLLRASELLQPGGRMVLSTCRYGLLARLAGRDWRFMNVPEHLYFFSVKRLTRLASELGFKVVGKVTYGSGLTTRKDASPFYRFAKRWLDPLVKVLGQGDMMVFHLEKMS